MNIKQHFCIVTQEEAYEARELLVKAGEEISELDFDFEVQGEFNILRISFDKIWYIGFFNKKELKTSTQLTYPQFKEMLNAKIKEDGK